MKIVIVGAGFTGIQLAKTLVAEKNEVTIIDNEEETVRHASNQLDCEVLQADGNKLETLEEVGIAKADALICLTESDEVNMITCSLVDAVYPQVFKIARVRNYAYYVNTASAKKSHEETFSGDHRPLYGIDRMIHPDVEAADSIVRAVQSGAVSDAYTFEGTDLQLTRMTLTEKSVLCGKQLKDIRTLSDCHFLVAYIENEESTTLPSGNTELKAGMSVGMLAKKEDTRTLLELCGSEKKEMRKIALVGAGKIGTIIAEKLIEHEKKSFVSRMSDFFRNKNVHAVKKPRQLAIIDSDDELVDAASESFQSALVYRADATDEAFLRQENIVSYDLTICVTPNMELNMVMAAYLESLGVGQSIALVANSAFGAIARKLGVDVPVPLRDVVVDAIMSHLRGDSVKEIHTLTNGDLEIIECELLEDSEACGKSLREVSNPGVYLVLMIRPKESEAYTIAGGTTTFEAGDHVVLITDSEQTAKTLSLFGNS